MREEVRERGMREEVRERGVREEEREGGGSEGGGAISTASTYRRTASVLCPVQRTL